MSSSNGQSRAGSSPLPPVFEVTSKAAEVAGVNSLVVTPVSGAEAYRRYSWLFGPQKNVAGNFRGMVVNVKAKKIYLISSGGAGKALAVASVVLELVKEFSNDATLTDPNVGSLEKTRRILFNGGFAILRGVTSIVPFTLGAVLVSLEGYVKLAGLVSDRDAGAAEVVVNLEELRKFINETHQRQWSGEYWYDIMTAQVDKLVARQ